MSEHITDLGARVRADQIDSLIEKFEVLISVLEEIRDQHRPQPKDYTVPPPRMFDYIQGQYAPPNHTQFRMARYWLGNPDPHRIEPVEAFRLAYEIVSRYQTEGCPQRVMHGSGSGGACPVCDSRGPASQTEGKTHAP
jgi:hypothetical protein